MVTESYERIEADTAVRWGGEIWLVEGILSDRVILRKDSDESNPPKHQMLYREVEERENDPMDDFEILEDKKA